MNSRLTRIIAASFIICVIGLFAMSFSLFPYGYVGTTKKDGVELGCICHGEHAPTDSVIVSVTGPDSVPVGQTAVFLVTMSHGPAVVGGFNVAADTGTVNPVIGDTMVQRIEYPSGWGTYELTHTHPKSFTAGLVSWTFTYTAPGFPVVDTLYATGNSTNNDTLPESDQWNFSSNKPVRVYNPIGIINISSVAKGFSLSQNYPNPFNPVTQINFSVGKPSDVQIKIYDVLGNLVSTLVNENLKQGEYKTDFNASGMASGTYFYTLFSNGERISTKKMLVVK